jgi:inner membrane protein
MDSLTQITLGAAVGEMVAGKKIGNRAMLWGAVAGTIPDLDVIIGSIFMDDLSALAFHRGFMHSFTFAFLFSIIMAFFVYKLYDTEYYQKNAHKISVMTGGVLIMLFMAGIMNVFPLVIDGRIRIWVVLLSLILIGFFTYRLWKNYYKKTPLEPVKISFQHWYLFFLLTIVTHPILDCFTTYGTQLFQPFSKLRVAWDNISVFDPLYTAPFLIFLLAASFMRKGSDIRTFLNIAGVLISSAYMVWTFSNKSKVEQVFKSSLEENNLGYSRILTTPTIANNLLWNCVADGDSVFYTGFYSLLDKEPIVKDIITIPSNKRIISGFEEDEAIQTLQWFSNGFQSYLELENNKVQVNDLRYGRFRANDNDPDNYIFKFTLEKQSDDTYQLTESVGGPPDNQEGWIQEFWTRLKGI